MNILIADDHALLRTGLKQALADDLPAATIGEAATTQETLACLECEDWDLLILDLFMPGRGGFEVLADVRRNHPRLPVLVLSSAPEEQLAVRALRAGAAGYVNKQAAADELGAAVHKLLAGGRYVSGTMAELLARDAARPTAGPPHERLSAREFDVLLRLARGQSLKAIAAELHLSAKTISTFHTRVLRKLDLSGDIELARYVLEYHLVYGES